MEAEAVCSGAPEFAAYFDGQVRFLNGIKVHTSTPVA
jgi:hypothetical protein